MNPLIEIATFWELLCIIRKEKFDMIHTFSHKPNIYGSVAAKFCRVRLVVNHLEGLGYIYTENTMKTSILSRMLSIYYWISSHFIDRMVFQNYEDYMDFRFIIPINKTAIIKGVGVDVQHFSNENVNMTIVEEIRRRYFLTEKTIIVTMVGRLLYHKGIREFIEAANRLSLLTLDERLLFFVIGAKDIENPASVTDVFIKKSSDNSMIRFLGERSDIREILYITDIFVLPSYREGTSQAILEAMSMKKPVITTNVRGCSHTVDHMSTGVIIPSKDIDALTNALKLLVSDKPLRAKMGIAGRHKVEMEFSVEKIIEELISLYNTLQRDRMEKVDTKVV